MASEATLSHLETTRATTDVVNRFIDAFHNKDASAIPDLVADDCVMEAIQPAPNGERVEGYDANVRFWRAMVSDPVGSFELEAHTHEEPHAGGTERRA
jgi:ketosteroid isomerase-like protein